MRKKVKIVLKQINKESFLKRFNKICWMVFYVFGEILESIMEFLEPFVILALILAFFLLMILVAALPIFIIFGVI